MSRWRLALLVFGGVCLGGVERAAADWHPASHMLQARTSHTATLLDSGKVLVIGGAETDVGLAGTEIFDPATGSWAPSGDFPVPIEGHTATLLRSGLVLVAGGNPQFGLFTSPTANLYDPVAGTFNDTYSHMTQGRALHTATLLTDGKVFVVGGTQCGLSGGCTDISAPELYDPDLRQWSTINLSPTLGGRITATLLPVRDIEQPYVDRILVTKSTSAWIEIYTYAPGTGNWSLTSQNLLGLAGVEATTVLPSGKVLLVGNTSSEIWDPVNATEQAGGAHDSLSAGSATLLPSGKVLVLGTDTSLPIAEIFDPSSAWATIPNRPNASGAAVLLPGGGLLVTGALSLSNATSNVELFVEEPIGNVSSPAPLPPLMDSLLFLLHSGRVLAVGLSNAFIFDEGSWTEAAAPPQAGGGFPFRGVVLPSGEVFVTDGSNAWEYTEPPTNRWTQVASPLPLATSLNLSLTLLKTGKALLIGDSSSQLFDPDAGTWQKTTGSPSSSLFFATTSILLPSGKVLLTGGDVGRAEIYDPETEQWTATGLLNRQRISPKAVLLPSGKVFVVGGAQGQGATLSLVSTPEVYDPATGVWTELAPPSEPFADPPTVLEATLLPTGDVFVNTVTQSRTDGTISTKAYLYSPSTDSWDMAQQVSGINSVHPGSLGQVPISQVLLRSGKLLVSVGPLQQFWIFDPLYAARPSSAVIQSVTPPVLTYGEPLVIEGTGFRGVTEASGGQFKASVNFPLVQLRSLDGRTNHFLTPSQPNFSDQAVTFSAADFPPGSLDPGLHLLSVVVAGVASDPVPIDVDCRAKYTANPDQTATPILGATGLQGEATFLAHCAGAEHYQWRKNDLDLVGATGASYTTPPITREDIGSSYSVVCRSSCDDIQTAASSHPQQVPLEFTDATAPMISVLSPAGGELWVLTPSDASTPNQQTIAWSMSDDGVICTVAVKLLYSQDGVHFQSVGNDLFMAGIPADECTVSNRVTTTSMLYNLPTVGDLQQQGVPLGSVFKIEVDATDEAGHRGTAQSSAPFYLVNPATQNAVQTLILSRLSSLPFGPGEEAALRTSLANLAKFPNAPGVWIELDQVLADQVLTSATNAWQACPGDPACDVNRTANGLVAAIKDYLAQEVFPVYPNLRYLVLVGDDRFIPFARIADSTAFPENTYVDGNLAGQDTTVGAAIAKNFYLTDDVIAAQSNTPPFLDGAGLSLGDYLPDLAVGRLVETPAEITRTVNNFIAQNGVLDLKATLGPTASSDSKVLVTGYDFLLDSASALAKDWKDSISSTAVDSLLGSDWTGPDLRASLLKHPRISFLNGHATHFEEGVPGTSASNGLPAATIEGIPAPGLSGGVVFAVGCHGGLTVPGADLSGTDPDHSLDLPQTFLDLGAITYVANSGFGWGLVDGIGYSERLITLLSDQLRAGGTVVVGDAVRTAKRLYFRDRGFENESYDQKILFEWTLFGLPMYAVKTGIAPSPLASARSLTPRTEVPAVEQVGPVTVRRRPAPAPTSAAADLPPSLVQLSLAFDFTAQGVYGKHNAAGAELHVDQTCNSQAGGQAGCYYTLNGLSTSAADLPILPYFVYDSRLSGATQHGALWTRAGYVEESGWTSVTATLTSQGVPVPHNSSLPIIIQPHPVLHGRPIAPGAACQASDLDDSLVVVPAETLGVGAETRHRRFDTVDIELLYLSSNSSGNCDRAAPTIAPGTYHHLDGSTVTWNVPVGGADVWRVLVLYDLGPDPETHAGAWVPLELASDGSGNWTGSLPLLAGRGLTYLIEAVSRHGNVGWLATGIQDIPVPTVVDAPPTPAIASPLPTDTFGVGDTIVLAGSAVDSLGGALPGSALSWTVLLHQGSQVRTVFGPASGASVSFTAPPPASLAAAVDGYLEIQLTATDAMGLSNTVSRRLDPARVAVTFATQPAGLTLTINGAALVTPQSVTSWRGYPIDLEAHTQTGAGGERYVFQSWSDGGGWAHTLVTPAAPATDTAVFVLSQATGPLSFYTVRPCRIIDTRQPLGPMGGPPLSAGQVRSFTLSGVCKVPEAARAVAVNVTIVNPTGTGYLIIHPADQPAMATSVLNFMPGAVRSNNAILYLGETGTVAVTFVGSPGTVDFVMDLVGFFE